MQMGNQNWHTWENQKPKNPGERCATGLRMDTQVNWEWYSEDCSADFDALCVDGGPDRKLTSTPDEVDSGYPDIYDVLVLLFLCDVISLQLQR